MRSRPLALAALSLVLLGTTTACAEGSGDAAEPAATRTTTTTPSATPSPTATTEHLSLTQAQVEAALLHPTDVAADWVVEATGFDLFAEEESTGPSTVEPTACGPILDALEADDVAPTATAKVHLTNGDATQLVAEQVETVPGTTAADIEAMAAAIAACPTFTETDADGVVTSFELLTLPVPSLGDGSVAFALTGTSDDFEAEIDAVLIAAGDEQITLLTLGVTDASVLTQVATAAVAKVQAV